MQLDDETNRHIRLTKN